MFLGELVLHGLEPLARDELLTPKVHSGQLLPPVAVARLLVDAVLGAGRPMPAQPATFARGAFAGEFGEYARILLRLGRAGIRLGRPRDKFSAAGMNGPST